MFLPFKKTPRLLRWDGRKRSSRLETPFWQLLCQKDRWLPLCLVAALVVAATAVVYCWGPPFTYRAGEQFPHDLRVRATFELINQVELLNQDPPAAPGSLPVEDQTVQPKRDADQEVTALESYPKGIVLVQRNKPITERQLALLKEEHRAYYSQVPVLVHLQRAAALLAIFSCLAGLIALYAARFPAETSFCMWRLAILVVLLFITLVAGLILATPPWNAMFLPLTMTAMILALAYESRFAVSTAVGLAVAMTVAVGADLYYALVMIGGLSTAVLLLRDVRTRTRLVQVASIAGLVFMCITLAVGLQSRQNFTMILGDALQRFFWGALAGFLLTGLLPIVERVFGIVTDISLLELADGSHPLLQELVRRAPGTYTHSITVATLAEAAADAIGANPLLTRVGAYFHDVGKMLKPQYFVENQDGVNRHESLEPALSTLIIIGHVKDGIALARQYRLPRRIIDFIEQHHGTTLVEYFYREALRLLGDNVSSSSELEPSFRYPGPKPQNRENGIIMLADAVESASRSLVDPTPTRIRKLVHEIFMKRLLDGQFEESGLTLSELHLIEESLCKSLIALFHVRIKYEDDPVTNPAA